MKTIFNIFLLISISFNALAQNTISLGFGNTSAKASINDVDWIAGHWQGEASGGITEDIWSPPLGNSMVATFRLTVDNKVSFYEIETITEEKGTLILR